MDATLRRVPGIDVVVPCFNYGHYLPACVKSVLSQTGVDVRVLVIDDCSTDDSGEIAERIASGDRRVAVVRHERNQGHIATYNEGLLGWADREYTVLLSADDLLAPGCLARAAAVMDSAPEVGMVYGHAPYFERNDAIPSQRSRRTRSRTWSGHTWLEKRCRSGVNVISSPEVVCRTSVQHRIGGYSTELPHVGDLEMWMRFAAISDVGYIRGAPQAYYRVHSASMQRTVFSAHLDDLRQRRDGFEYFFDHAGTELADIEHLRNLARRALAREALWRAGRAYDRDDLDHTPVDELTAFATATDPAAASLPEYRGLRRRRRLGPAFCHRTQVFLGSGVRHRAHSWYRDVRWKRTGV